MKQFYKFIKTSILWILCFFLGMLLVILVTSFIEWDVKRISDLFDFGSPLLNKVYRGIISFITFIAFLYVYFFSKSGNEKDQSSLSN